MVVAGAGGGGGGGGVAAAVVAGGEGVTRGVVAGLLTAAATGRRPLTLQVEQVSSPPPPPLFSVVGCSVGGVVGDGGDGGDGATGVVGFAAAAVVVVVVVVVVVGLSGAAPPVNGGGDPSSRVNPSDLHGITAGKFGSTLYTLPTQPADGLQQSNIRVAWLLPLSADCWLMGAAGSSVRFNPVNDTNSCGHGIHFLPTILGFELPAAAAAAGSSRIFKSKLASHWSTKLSPTVLLLLPAVVVPAHCGSEPHWRLVSGPPQNGHLPKTDG